MQFKFYRSTEVFKIAVLSDTHIPRRGREIPREVMEGIQGVDLIVHAGDINQESVLYELEEIAPVEAVAGNTDSADLWELLGRKKILSIGNQRIGIVHGDEGYGPAYERARKAFSDELPNCILFGHSHAPFHHEINGVLYFNPGSPTDKRLQEKPSYGMLTIHQNKITGEIIFLEK